MDRALKPLCAITELDDTLADSHERPVLLFKHSYTCGISAEALDELRAHIEAPLNVARGGQLRPVRYAIVTVQTHRDVCHAIAARLGVRHETPQAILVRNGRAVWSASHFRVTAAEIQKAMGIGD